MTKTICLLAQKGGTGKTTLCLHLAVLAGDLGLDATVIDIDPQASASAWKRRRQQDTPEVVRHYARDLSSVLADLEQQLKAADAAGARFKLITTDGMFSMDGYIARLDEICDLAERYGAMVMVDGSHATGYIGATGRGTPEHHGVQGRVDVITSTLGKALGGASGGYTTGRQEIIDMLRQRSRPYLFSNTLTPSLTAAGIKVFEMLSASTELRDKLMANTRHFRSKLEKLVAAVLEGAAAMVPGRLCAGRACAGVPTAGIGPNGCGGGLR